MDRYHTPHWAQVDLLHVTWLCAVPAGGPKHHHNNLCGQSVICHALATTCVDIFHDRGGPRLVCSSSKQPVDLRMSSTASQQPEVDPLHARWLPQHPKHKPPEVDLLHVKNIMSSAVYLSHVTWVVRGGLVACQVISYTCIPAARGPLSLHRPES